MYYKLLETFILRTCMKEGEYKINNVKFNPLKTVMWVILSSSFFLSIYLLIKINTIHTRVTEVCPAYFEVNLEQQLEPLSKKENHLDTIIPKE